MPSAPVSVGLSLTRVYRDDTAQYGYWESAHPGEQCVSIDIADRQVHRRGTDLKSVVPAQSRLGGAGLVER